MKHNVFYNLVAWFSIENLRYHFNASNKNDIKTEKQLRKALRKMGYKLYFIDDFNSKTFKTKDSQVVPIILKYLPFFEHEGNYLQVLSSLGVQGFYGATEYLIEQYRKNISPQYKERTLNVISQTLLNILDERYIGEYIDLLKGGNVVASGYIIQMLGKLKVKQSIPELIELLDRETILPPEWIGTPLEEHRYYTSLVAIETLGEIGNAQHIAFVEKFLKPQELKWIAFSESPWQNELLQSTRNDYKLFASKAIEKMNSRSTN